jgi:hypothetical protein
MLLVIKANFQITVQKKLVEILIFDFIYHVMR